MALPPSKKIIYKFKACLIADDKEFFTLFENLQQEIYTDPLYTRLQAFGLPIIQLSQRVDTNSASTQKKKKEQLTAMMYKISSYLKNVIGYNKVPDDILNRKLFKVPGMTTAYGAGDVALTTAFHETIIDYFVAQGLHASPLKEEELQGLVTMFKIMFTNIIYEHWKVLPLFLRTTTNFVKSVDDTKPVGVTLKYLSWSFIQTAKKLSRHTVTTKNSKHKFTVYNNFGIIRERMPSTFPSIFVQGLDAHIVHTLIANVRAINKDLREHNLPEIYISTNHDCFAINSIYSNLLIPLVQKAYNSINELSIPEISSFIPKDNPAIRCTNPNFIKH